MEIKEKYADQKENPNLQLRMVQISLGLDLTTAFPVLVISILSNSIVLFTDIFDYSYNIISNIIALIILTRIIKGKIVSYDYGSGKLESMASLITSIIVVTGLAVTAGLCIMRFINPERINEGFTLIGFLINFIALLLNIFLWWKVYSIAVTSGSRIMEFQWRMHRTNALTCAGIFLALVLTLVTRDYSFGAYIDPACALIFICIAGFGFIDLIKDNLNDLLDKTLEEDLQMTIIRRLSEYFDFYDTFHGVKSRRTGKKKLIDISLGFNSSRTAGEIFDISSRIKEKIENDMPESEVRVYPRANKEFEEVCRGKKFAEGLKLKALSEKDIEEALNLLKKYLPKENYTVVKMCLEESCKLGANTLEIVKNKYMNPRFWVVFFNEKLIGLGGIYTNPDEPEAVYGGWTVVDQTVGITASRSFKLLGLKMSLEGHKTGRKFFRVITSDLPEEAMMNRAYEHTGIRIYKKSIDLDGTNLLYRQGDLESLCNYFCSKT